MALQALKYALERRGISPHQKLLLVLLADDIDTDGCYRQDALPALQETACMTGPEFGCTWNDLVRAEGAYLALNRDEALCWHFPTLSTSQRPYTPIRGDDE